MRDKDVMKPETLAIIPARGGSKGLPRKNVRPLLGKPLLCWTIEQARASKAINCIHVSTDDPEIAAVAGEFGNPPLFLRPAEFAQDSSPTIDAIVYTLDRYADLGKEFDIVALLEPTSPLRAEADLDSALNLLRSRMGEADSLVSLGEVHTENPYICKHVSNGWVTPFITSDQLIYQRQQLPKVYFPYGVVYASKTSTLRQQRSFYQDRTIPYYIQRWQNYEIDDIYDFCCVESVMKYEWGLP